jgi:hypothetical protein
LLLRRTTSGVTKIDPSRDSSQLISRVTIDLSARKDCPTFDIFSVCNSHSEPEGSAGFGHRLLAEV